jgi:FkbM family methyltransferase
MYPAIFFNLLCLRLEKLWICLTKPIYWRPLLIGVAPAVEHRKVLALLRPDGVLDVGANRGQFSLACRLAYLGVPVCAFEPIPKEAILFRRVHSRIPYITLIETALGETPGKAILHLSRSADSSSLLPIGNKQRALFSHTEEVGTISVPVHRLDDFSSQWAGRSRQLLKIDVQGFELSVLHGAIETLKTCAYVYVECSEISLYDGQALRVDVQSFLEGLGYVCHGRYNDYRDGGLLVQADYLFVRH